MIRSFATERTRRVFAREREPSFSPDLQRAAWKKLAILHAAGSLSDLRVAPGNRLERLSAQRQGQYGIRINDQWGICFSWRDRDAFEVEIVDYH
ncbi:MAG: type II toxin-antitoxin system RelE/ParE family toxin [Anaerolineales bacterium]|nr:type II toxin-antitoxin system RelE/ParE family toxin [Anaerolineales bacterium]